MRSKLHAVKEVNALRVTHYPPTTVGMLGYMCTLSLLQVILCIPTGTPRLRARTVYYDGMSVVVYVLFCKILVIYVPFSATCVATHKDA